MYRERKIAVVMPAHNEERLIKPTLESVPKLVDQVYVVDDCSTDQQNTVVREFGMLDPRVTLLVQPQQTGPGGAIITGYLKAFEDKHDIVVVVGADNQMPLDEIERFLDPIVDGKAEYVKGNRFLVDQIEDTLAKMPTIRIFGNWLITALAKFASGLFRTMDFVDGYTAISRKALATVNWKKAWQGYGYPMDFLIRMNAYRLRVLDVPRTAIYLKGERQSQIKGMRYFLRVSPMLLRGFFWRLKFKYFYLDFHPLLVFYGLGFFSLMVGGTLAMALLANKIFSTGEMVTGSYAVLTALFIFMGIQFSLFGVFFDMIEDR